MRDKALVRSRTKLIPHSTTPTQRTRYARRRIRQSQPIQLSPVLDPVWDSRQACAPPGPTIIRNGPIRQSMKVEDGDIVPAGIARLDRQVDGLTHIAKIGDIKRPRYGRKGGHPLREVLVACQYPYEPATLGFTRREDAVLIDAVLLLELIEDVTGEADIVGRDLWYALPCCLHFVEEKKSSSPPYGQPLKHLLLGGKDMGQSVVNPLTLIPLGYTTMYSVLKYVVVNKSNASCDSAVRVPP